MHPIIHIKETDSTNNFLRKEILLNNDLMEGTVVFSDFQTAGKGQRGNSWESEDGQNLLFSMVLYPTFLDANRQFIISQIVSLAITDILGKYTNGITIKWPNDIYWQKKKICGILIENDLMGETIKQSIIGIGLNINQKEFRSNAPNPVSLYQITEQEHKREDLLGDIIERTHHYYDKLRWGEEKEVKESYKKHLFRKEGYHFFSDGIHSFEAKIKEVEDSGLLVLEDRSGEERIFAFKEIQYIL